MSDYKKHHQVWIRVMWFRITKQTKLRPTHTKCRASSVLSLQVMAGAVSVNHSPEANRRGHPAGNPAACAEQRPRTAKRHLEPAGHAGFVSDSAGDKDLSAGPEGAEMGLWTCASAKYLCCVGALYLDFYRIKSTVLLSEHTDTLRPWEKKCC